MRRNWQTEYHGVDTDGDGNPLDTDARYEARKELIIYGPVIGTIVNVYYCNIDDNYSFKDTTGEDTFSPAIIDTTVKELTTGPDGEIKEVTDPSPGFTVEMAGPHFECDVLIEDGLYGEGDAVILPHVPLPNSFGGIKNFGFVTPHGTTNTSLVGSGKYYDGDRVIVAFLGGRKSNPVIIGYYPHPVNVLDGPRYYPGEGGEENGAFCRVNGSEFTVSPSGDMMFDLTNANIGRDVDPNTGALDATKPSRIVPEAEEGEDRGSPPGMFSVATRSDQVFNASYGFEEVEVGGIFLQSKTETTIRSELDEINIFTDSAEKRVVLQGIHEGLSDAARKGDKIKITSGDDNDLFKWAAEVNTALGAVSAALTALNAAIPGPPLPDVIAAVAALETASELLVTYSEGEIIEGSPLVQIGKKAES